jgi:protein CMS1
MSDTDTEGGVPLVEDQFDNIHPSRKRKAEEEPETDLNEAELKKAKKAKQKAKNKIRNKKKGKEINQLDLNQELGVNHVFERMDGQLLADYINARTRLYGKELSSDELEKQTVSGKTRILLHPEHTDEK